MLSADLKRRDQAPLDLLAGPSDANVPEALLIYVK
jgi:hypothetical protein